MNEWFVPFGMQAALMVFDEGYFHRGRGLGPWERWGHPLDTVTFLLCLGWLFLMPPSERATRITQVSSGLMRTHALTSVPSLPAACASAVPISGRLNPSASPPPAAAEPTTKLRRETMAAVPLILFFTADLP